MAEGIALTTRKSFLNEKKKHLVDQVSLIIDESAVVAVVVV